MGEKNKQNFFELKKMDAFQMIPSLYINKQEKY